MGKILAIRAISATMTMLWIFSISSHAQRTAGRIAPPAENSVYSVSSGTSIEASRTASLPSGLRSLSPDGRAAYSDVQEALSLIERHHAHGGTIQRDSLIKGAVKGMLSVLDPHSNYFGDREFQELLSDQDSFYSGIGVTISEHRLGTEKGLYVVDVTERSPAALAGLGFGDKLISVDGHTVEGLEADAVRSLIVGPKGTDVVLTIENAARGDVETVTVTRARIASASVGGHYILREGVGYIELRNGFTEATSSEIRSALRDLKTLGMTSLILDLRGNPGGLVAQAVKTAELFLRKGSIIMTQRGRHSYDNVVWRSANHNPETMRLVLLVNASTASAAEIVAGSLQDHDRALVIGETTFGKGLVQSLLDLPAGGGLALTTARYFTPSGRSLQRDYSTIDPYTYFTRNQRFDRLAIYDFGARTKSGRLLHGGDGVRPDIVVSDDMDDAYGPLKDSEFFLIRDLIAKRGYTHGESTSVEDWLAMRPDAQRRISASTLHYIFASIDLGPTLARQVLARSDRIVLKAVEEISRNQTTTFCCAVRLESNPR